MDEFAEECLKYHVDESEYEYSEDEEVEVENKVEVEEIEKEEEVEMITISLKEYLEMQNKITKYEAIRNIIK